VLLVRGVKALLLHNRFWFFSPARRSVTAFGRQDNCYAVVLIYGCFDRCHSQLCYRAVHTCLCPGIGHSQCCQPAPACAEAAELRSAVTGVTFFAAMIRTRLNYKHKKKLYCKEWLANAS